MAEIKTLLFDKKEFDQMRSYHFGINWPVVYLIEDGREIYIGETVNIYGRSNQHYENPERKKLKRIHIISDEEYNKSATLDIESSLIQYMSAEGSFVLQNGNQGLLNHNYYDRQKYQAKFETIWQKLQEMSLVKKDLVQIKNSDLFKYSPYKSLTEDQIIVARSIFKDIKENKEKTFVVNGKPGTGKTILAVYLAKFLKEKEETKNLEIALVVPMTSLRKTIRKVFSQVKGLKTSMVIGPNEVVNKNYDILIVDEAHRLKQRKNIANYQSFDITNKKLDLDNSGTELDWILKSSKHQIFFYDKNQTIKPADVRPRKFTQMNAVHYDLTSQQRISAGEEYINFIDDLFDLKNLSKYSFPNYDLRFYEDIHKMVDDIKKKDLELKLCRIVAGYAWEWKSKNNPNIHDIEIDGLKLFWNSTNQDWVNSKNAINEVGCIHTVQGYDLNYVGVIIGPELSYDEENNKLIINSDNYMDTNGWRGITDPLELERYIINIYKTLLTRGIKGTFIYAVDKKLAEYFKNKINNKEKEEKIISLVRSPYADKFEMVSVPLFESVGCGELMYADPTVQEMISVRKDYMSKGSKYFVLRTKGDSMNKAGINDGDLVLCVKNYRPEEGKKVVALIGDDATIKEYRRENGYLVLKPNSSNSEHKPLKFKTNEEVRMQGVVVRVLDKNEIWF
ncbi:MAG: DUF2075 domain-containing protein [Candidatus Nomurabacteria bacterium]|nr:DUF2075 domain-containing protein [Candidatus Nomurabacteria bacterium]